MGGGNKDDDSVDDLIDKIQKKGKKVKLMSSKSNIIEEDVKEDMNDEEFEKNLSAS